MNGGEWMQVLLLGASIGFALGYTYRMIQGFMERR